MGKGQGAVLSPLLSNIYLNPMDHLMSAKGFQMVRYADDFVILCRTQEEAEVAGPAADYGGWLDIDVKDVNQIDFVAIDRALRDEGMVASQMQFGGVRHFRFEAQVRHLCCGMCKDACERMPELAKTRQSGRLKWLDSVVAERATGKVTIHARYLEPDQRIDAAELMGAMDELGLPPFSLKIVMSAEEQALAAPIR